MDGPDLAVQDVIQTLDGFYCHNVTVGLWAAAVANRLEGMAIYLLSDELPEVADQARAAARRLADRIGNLGGASPLTPGSLSTARRARPSSRSRTAPPPARSPPTRCSASTFARLVSFTVTARTARRAPAASCADGSVTLVRQEAWALLLVHNMIAATAAAPPGRPAPTRT